MISPDDLRTPRRPPAPSAVPPRRAAETVGQGIRGRGRRFAWLLGQNWSVLRDSQRDC